MQSALTLYWVISIAVFGALALAFSSDIFLHAPNRDIWQHLAALRALIENPTHPPSPFVPGEGVSRHFHPYWFLLAVVARALRWTEWDAMHLGAFVSLSVLATGIFAFGRAYYRSDWGPLALMGALLLGWLFPFGHTGLHSLPSLFEGAAYPATLLIGLSLILWAVAIASLSRPRLWLAIIPLVAFMFATHQLGAGIGLVGAFAIVAFWPGSSLRGRVLVGVSILLGLALASAWPLFNPFRAVLAAGNPQWRGPPDFYNPALILMSLTPAVFGILGLVRPLVPGSRWVFLSALAFYVGAFLLGIAGVMIGARFLMPTILVLHIGMGALIIRIFRGEILKSSRGRIAFAALAWLCVVTHFSAFARAYWRETPSARMVGNIYDRARALTADIPDDEPIAAYDVAVWPIVADGQKAMSVPWPEPFIQDLSERQAAVELLFDPALTRSQRISLAQRYGVRSLFIDERFALLRKPSPRRLAVLMRDSQSFRRSGPLWRFDLE